MKPHIKTEVAIICCLVRAITHTYQGAVIDEYEAMANSRKY
jgi:hypothetical protein